MSMCKNQNKLILILSLCIFLISQFHVADAVSTPEELDAKLVKLNENAFSINHQKLSKQEITYFEEAKKYLADAQLNYKYGNYGIVEELLNNAEKKLAIISHAAKKQKTFTLSAFSIRKIIIAAMLVAVIAIMIVLINLMTRSKNARQIEQLTIPYDPITSQMQNSGKCPKCSGRMYKNVCVWCSAETKKSA